MPKRRRMKAALLKRARAEKGPDATALDYVCGWIAAGGLIKDLAASLQEQLSESVSRSILSTLVHHLAPDASSRINAARRMGATDLAQHAVQSANYVRDSSSACVAKARLDTRTWPSAHADHASYGDKGNPVAVEVNFAQFHLEALRARHIERRPPTREAEAEIILNPRWWPLPEPRRTGDGGRESV